jgi:hypothetical protein
LGDEANSIPPPYDDFNAYKRAVKSAVERMAPVFNPADSRIAYWIKVERLKKDGAGGCIIS